MTRFLLVTALAFSSLYVFPSGNPQPSDFILVLFAGIVGINLIINGMPFNGRAILLPWLVLIVWIVFVQFAWIIIDHNIRLMQPLFYVYNFLIGAAIVQFVSASEDGVGVLAFGVKLGLIVSGVGIVLNILFPVAFLGVESYGRVTGFFNNPNQLSYYSICMLGLLLVLQRFHLSFNLLTLTAMACGVLGILSPTSLAGMAGLVVLILAIMVANWNSVKNASRLLLVLTLLPLVVVTIDLLSSGTISESIESRLSRMDTKVADIESERNYDRILAFPEYWVFGAGEGHFARFYPYDKNEIHSSIGTLFFSYGFIAVVFFAFLLFRCLRLASLSAWLVFAAPMLYGITHMGLRTTVFWLLLVAIWLMYSRSSHRQQSRNHVYSKTAHDHPRYL